MDTNGSWKWGLGVVSMALASTLAYFAVHSYPPEVRVVISSVLATVSGALWIYSSALPVGSLTGGRLAIAAAGCAMISSICLLP